MIASNCCRIGGWTIASRSSSTGLEAKTIEPKARRSIAPKGSSGVRPVRNHQGAKSLDHLAANLGVLEHLMAHTVGVDHDRPPFAQQSSDMALAAANGGGQTDHGDRPCSTGGQRSRE